VLRAAEVGSSRESRCPNVSPTSQRRFPCGYGRQVGTVPGYQHSLPMIIADGFAGQDPVDTESARCALTSTAQRGLAWCCTSDQPIRPRSCSSREFGFGYGANLTRMELAQTLRSPNSQRFVSQRRARMQVGRHRAREYRMTGAEDVGVSGI